MLFGALPQKSDYSVTFGANVISAPKVILTFSDELKSNGRHSRFDGHVSGDHGRAHRICAYSAHLAVEIAETVLTYLPFQWRSISVEIQSQRDVIDAEH